MQLFQQPTSILYTIYTSQAQSNARNNAMNGGVDCPQVLTLKKGSLYQVKSSESTGSRTPFGGRFRARHSSRGHASSASYRRAATETSCCPLVRSPQCEDILLILGISSYTDPARYPRPDQGDRSKQKDPLHEHLTVPRPPTLGALLGKQVRRTGPKTACNLSSFSLCHARIVRS